MKYQKIIEIVFFSPWLIKPQAHAAIRRLVLSRILSADLPQREDGVDFCGSKVEVDQPEVIDGIAHIPIGGVIARKLTAFERGAGAVDTLDIGREVRAADRDKNVKGILLDIDSPGGIVNGTPELADEIAAVNKPVFAYSAGMMDSAAYWIASAADQIFATRSADVGSIGVYAPFFDESKAMEDAGVQVDIIRSGPYKGMGFPGTKLTEEQRAEFQREVDSIAAEFKNHVRSFRMNIPDEAMQGQSFMGSEAHQMGLIDELVTGIEDVRRLL